jgi:hypothetical protein
LANPSVSTEGPRFEPRAECLRRYGVHVIPSLTRYGILPSAEHICTIDEIEQRFAINDHRRRLWAGFLAYVAWVKSLDAYMYLLVGGSFVTDQPDPEDIDVVLVWRTGLSSRSQDEKFKIATAMMPDFTKPKYGVQAWPIQLLLVLVQMRDEEADARGCPRGTKKGALRVNL